MLEHSLYPAGCRVGDPPMLRVLDRSTGPPAKVQPRTALLRQGFDLPYPDHFVHQEEVPSAHPLFQTSGHRRSTDGSVYVRQRVCGQAGRDEGSSGLNFDAPTARPGHMPDP